MIGRRIALRSQRKSSESIHHETDVASEQRLSKLLTPERKAKVQDYFNRYGSWTVFFGRFIAGLRGAIFLSAGLTGFPLGRFILLDGLAAVVSVPLWIYLGYWAGSKWDTVLESLKEYQAYVIATLALMIILGVIIKKIRNHSSQETI